MLLVAALESSLLSHQGSHGGPRQPRPFAAESPPESKDGAVPQTVLRAFLGEGEQLAFVALSSE